MQRELVKNMGTNYYLNSLPCLACGHSEKPLHIGKSSAGWCFALQVYPERGINTLDDWRKKIAENQTWFIKDEYGNNIAPKELMQIITERRWEGKSHLHDQKWLDDNYAQAGPNCLVRSRISDHCVGHGEGTWDYIVGQFS